MLAIFGASAAMVVELMPVGAALFVNKQYDVWERKIDKTSLESFYSSLFLEDYQLVVTIIYQSGGGGKTYYQLVGKQ